MRKIVKSLVVTLVLVVILFNMQFVHANDWWGSATDFFSRYRLA